MRLKLAWAVLVFFAAAALYGYNQEGLSDVHFWAPEGLSRFKRYLAAFFLIAGVIVLRWPRFIAPAVAVTALAWAMWWTGGIAPLAVLYFLGSCYCLGRVLRPAARGVLATLVGAAVWAVLLWTAIHFPINYWWTYALAFAVPYLLARPQVLQAGFRLPELPVKRTDAAALAILLCVLGARFLPALKPEISSDGLSMHMALPSWVDFHHVWPFDHKNVIWSLMPSGADSIYAGVYLLGGAMAAKLANFAFLVLTCFAAVRIALRWGSPAKAYLGAALFASTPLVALVTSSLMIENVWAALLTGALLTVLEEDDPIATAILAGAAMSVKLIAVAFAAPLLLIAFWRARGAFWKPLLTAALLGLPVYVFTYAKSGNPVFPFLNMVFQSPDYYTFENFNDTTYSYLRPSWINLYELTFRSSKWVEGQAGAMGFHYFLLLVPAALLIRRRDQAVALAAALIGVLGVLLGAPNMRYMYAAMPIVSLAVVWTPWTFLAPLLIGLNLVFFGASTYYDPEFALFQKSGIEPYVAQKAPQLLLIDRLNREYPGEPAAFFSNDCITNFHGMAYLDSWHTERFWEKFRNQPDAASMAANLRSLGVRNVVAPFPRRHEFEVIQKFYDGWLDLVPNSQIGPLALYRLREAEGPKPKDTRPLAPGEYDDMEPRIEYTGNWLHDDQFAQPSGHTVSYSDKAGDKLAFAFEGMAIEYVYTKALNRGIAEVWIDGNLMETIDQYSAATAWRSSQRIAGLAPGVHTFEVRVTDRKNSRSSGTYADLDAIRIQ